MIEYNVGDWVRCTKDPLGYCTSGKLYEVIEVSIPSHTVVRVIGDDGAERPLWIENYPSRMECMLSHREPVDSYEIF